MWKRDESGKNITKFTGKFLPPLDCQWSEVAPDFQTSPKLELMPASWSLYNPRKFTESTHL